MNNKIFLVLAVAVILILGAWFVGKNNSTPQKAASSKLSVITSFYPLFFFSAEIAGDRAEVKNITPSGVEPHDFEPTAQDIAQIEKSNLLILNGGVEAWAEKIKDTIKVTTIVAGEGLFTQQIEEEGEVVSDPHIWLSPRLAKFESKKILEGLIKVDSQNSSYYQDQEKVLEEELDSLDQKYKEGLKNCQTKDFITSHAAFGYLASEYGLNQVPISGVSPDSEPSVKDLADLADFARINSVKYIFFESLVSPKLAKTLASEIGAQTLVLDPLEGLSDDDIAAGKNYFTVMEDNLKNLQTALQCQ